jgi:hypothetical protein
MKRLVGALGLAVLAACGADSESGGSAPTAATPTTAMTNVTSAAPTPESTAATVPATTAPAPATTAPAPVTAPTTQPPPSSAASTGPPWESEPTSGTAVVYASAGDEYAWLPVGWWDGTAWGSVEWPTPDVVIPASTFDTLSVASVEFPSGPMRGITDFEPTTYGCVDDTGLSSLELPIALSDVSDRWGYRLLAVTGDWDVQPRPVSAVGVDSPVYQELGESLVPDDQPVDPTLGDVVQVLRADLDGNGVEEVLFTFQHLTDSGGMGAPGEFSLVIARYPDATGAVVDEVLVEHFVPTPMDAPSPDRSGVMAIADLNGDGAMEVAIGSTYWEAANVSIYEFADGSLHQVMESGCGV